MLLLTEPSAHYAKLACQTFASVYPRLFAHLYVVRPPRKTHANMRRCADRSPQAMQLAQLVAGIKQQAAALLESPNAGARIGAAKACQYVVQVQTRREGDPRLLAREVGVHMVPADHPFLRPPELEAEAAQLFTRLVTLVFTSHVPDTIMVLVNVLTRLAAVTSHVRKVVIEALASWAPTALAGVPYVHVRSVETTVRLSMLHFLRHGIGEPHASQLAAALEAQKRRMDLAAQEFRHAQREQAMRRRGSADRDTPAAVPVKRSRSSTPADAPPAKRPSAPPAPPLSAPELARLSLEHVVELILLSLDAVPESQLRDAVARYAQERSASEAPADAGPVDPLKVDVGDEEIAAPRAATPEEEDAAPLASLEHFSLPPPTHLEESEAQQLVSDSVTRICQLGSALAPSGSPVDAATGAPVSNVHASLWIALVTRLATRGFDASTHPGSAREAPAEMLAQADRVREQLLRFVTSDFVRRQPVAQQWLAEEWACDRLRRKRGLQSEFYAAWLRRVLDALVQDTRIREQVLGTFLLELPELPSFVLDAVQALCLERDALNLGFTLLREIGASRPPLRPSVGERVMRLTRHRERLVRGKAIVTARSWVLQKGALAEQVMDYARASLQLLVEASEGHVEAAPAAAAADVADGKPADVAPAEAPHPDGAPAHAPSADAAPAEARAGEAEPQSPIVSAPEDITSPEEVLCLVELALVLSIKQPSFFREIVAIYPHVAPMIQQALQSQVAPVARSIGPNSTAFLEVLREFAESARTLVDSIVRILTDKGHTRALAQLIVELVETHAYDTHLLLPVMPELESEDVIRVLPRVVQLLGTNTPEDRTAVQNLFQALVAPALHPETGAPATAALSPVDLMVLLHVHEEEIGLKPAVAAIQMCFKMSEVYRGPELSAVLNRLADEPRIPLLIMRTAIMAVKTYHTLVNYVSTNILMRLANKKIWLEPRLWDGFALCASITAPTSFGTLLQLPIEQLQQVLERQPSIREPLRDYLVYKAGGRERHAELVDMLERTG